MTRVGFFGGQRFRKAFGGDGDQERIDPSKSRREIDVRDLDVRSRIVPGRHVQGRVSLEVEGGRLFTSPDEVGDVVGGPGQPGITYLDLVASNEILDLAVGVKDPVDRGRSAGDGWLPAGVEDVELVGFPADGDVLHLRRKVNLGVQEGGQVDRAADVEGDSAKVVNPGSQRAVERRLHQCGVSLPVPCLVQAGIELRGEVDCFGRHPGLARRDLGSEYEPASLAFSLGGGVTVEQPLSQLVVQPEWLADTVVFLVHRQRQHLHRLREVTGGVVDAAPELQQRVSDIPVVGNKVFEQFQCVGIAALGFQGFGTGHRVPDLQSGVVLDSGQCPFEQPGHMLGGHVGRAVDHRDLQPRLSQK